MTPAEAQPSGPATVLFRFRMYITGDTQNSVEAMANLRSLCLAHIPDRHEIEFVDVALDPRRALTDGIFMTPTLIKLAPAPTRMIVGTLSKLQPILQALGLDVATT
jgi:circadian clock protein KaiB